MSLKKVMLAASKAMRASFEYRTSQIPTAAYKGYEREGEVSKFLAEYLPKRFSLGQGFVSDMNIRLSQQQDIVIYDALNCPILCPGTTSQIFPVESVYATIEVKSKLTKAELESAISCLQSVKILRAVGGYTKKATTATVVVSPAPPPPLGAIFAFESDSELSTLKKNLEKLQSKMNPSQWINLIYIHDKGVLFYGSTQKITLQNCPDQSSKLEILDREEDSLFYFYIVLIGHLSVAEERVPNIRAYANIPINVIQDAIDSL